ncbi:MAG: YCF48-related protein, partial [Candidatus Bipolaricaulota bacterium]|nr:YCF48-related protein [Candidatus Bipolaricaulota bacterium]
MFGIMVLAGAIPATAQEVIWEECTIPIENLRINDLALVDAETAWAVGIVDANPGARPPQVVPTIIHTTDGGKTWNEHEAGVERGVLNAVCFLETEMTVAVGQDHGTRAPLVLWTANGGRNWSRATLPSGQGQGYLRSVIFASDGTGWGVGHDYDESESLLWHSSDLCTWTAQSHPIQEGARLSAIAFPAAMVGYAVGYISGESAKPFILKTADGGTTWTEVAPPLAEGALLDIFFLDEQIGWVVGASGDDGLVLKTTDGGASWEVTRVHYSPLYFKRVVF